MVSLVIAGISYQYPQTGDLTWGDGASTWAQAVTASMLQTSGGLFQITADVDFGSAKGLIALYFKSRTANTPSTGSVRLAKTDFISFRNNANSADLALGINGSDQLTFNGGAFLTTAGSISASKILVSDGSSNIISSSTNSSVLAFLDPTSSIQTQINTANSSITTTNTNLTTTNTNLSTHTGASTGVHGVTGSVVGTTDTQTLSAKTLTTPQVNGLKLALSTKTAAYTLLVTDDVIIGNSTSSPINYTLPTTTGKVFTVKNINTGVMIVLPGSGLIDGASNYRLVAQYDSATFIYDGTNYSVLHSNITVAAHANTTTSQAIAVGTTNIKFENTNYDTANILSTGVVTTFTAIAAGKYAFSATLVTSAPASNGVAQLCAFKNVSTLVSNGTSVNVAAGSNNALTITDAVNLALGDSIQFGIYATVGFNIGIAAAGAPGTAGTQNYASFERIGN
jgi:hypothetical protein